MNPSAPTPQPQPQPQPVQYQPQPAPQYPTSPSSVPFGPISLGVSALALIILPIIQVNMGASYLLLLITLVLGGGGAAAGFLALKKSSSVDALAITGLVIGVVVASLSLTQTIQYGVAYSKTSSYTTPTSSSTKTTTSGSSSSSDSLDSFDSSSSDDAYKEAMEKYEALYGDN